MQEQLYTWIADFTMHDRMAYLSHQETMTMLQRAMVRSRVPLVFSEGFNPRPHLSIPLPRSVGVQSDAERLCAIVRYEEAPDANLLAENVGRHLPEGCRILNSVAVAGKVTCHPAGYRLQFLLHEPVDPALAGRIRDCVAVLQTGGAIVIERYLAKKNAYKPLDIAPYVERAEFEEETIIDVRCRVSPEGTVRVDELMQWFHLQPEHLREPVRRNEIYWSTN